MAVTIQVETFPSVSSLISFGTSIVVIVRHVTSKLLVGA